MARYFTLSVKIVAPVAVAALILALFAGAPAYPRKEEAETHKIRLAYMPNVSHAQAIIGFARGDFAEKLGNNVTLVPAIHAAGPSIIEALYAGHADLAYVGPSPILNGFLNSDGMEVRVIAGSAMNGVVVVGNKLKNITSLEQLKGKKIATPQMGNTQDISARSCLVEKLKCSLAEHGGDTTVVPVSPAEVEVLFRKRQLDAAWLPEPWASRLIHAGVGTPILEEAELWPHREFALTSLVARRKFLEEHPDLVRRFLETHVSITRELQQNPTPFIPIINSELKRLSGKELPESILENAIQRTRFSVEPNRESFQRFYETGRKLGLIKKKTFDSDKLFRLELLEQVIRPQSNTAASDNASADEATSSP